MALPEGVGVSWIKLDDRMPEHPKVAGLSDRAFRAHIEALCYCAGTLTDGEITEAVAKKRGWTRSAEELWKCGLWETTDSGWAIHDYLEHQRSKESARSLSAKRAEAGSLGGKASANAKQNAGAVLNQIREEEIRNPNPTDSETSTKRVDDAFLAELAEQYPEFGIEGVKAELEKARNRKAWDGYKDKRAHFRNWMNNARTFRERDNANGRTGGNAAAGARAYPGGGGRGVVAGVGQGHGAPVGAFPVAKRWPPDEATHE